MAEAVVPHFVAGLKQGLHQPGVLLHLVPHDKKGAVGLVQFEQGHNLGGVDGGGAVVKGQGHGLFVGGPAQTVTGSAAQAGPGRAPARNNPSTSGSPRNEGD